MNSIGEIDAESSILQQREILLEQNPDLLFGIYSILENDESNKEIKLELSQNTLTCYPNQLGNLKGLNENQDISIINLNELRKGKTEVLFGKEVSISNPVLLSNGVIDYVVARDKDGNENKHIITTLRDGGGADVLQRTTTAGRNIGDNLYIEALIEHIEECPFLGKDKNGNYVLATLSKNSKNLEVLKDSINRFITQKHNLDRENDDDKLFIKYFERSFPGIKYEDLGSVLSDILENNRFMLYYFKDGEISGLESDTAKISINNNGKEASTGEFFSYFDKDNNTIEYRKIQEITGFEEGFIPLSKKPSRLFLESKNQYPRVPRLDNASLTSKLVPTIKYVSDKVREKLAKS